MEVRVKRRTGLPPRPLVTAITLGKTRGGTTRCAGGWSTWWITTAADMASFAWCVVPLWPHWRSVPSRGTSSRYIPTPFTTAQRRSSRPCWATTRLPCISSTLMTASPPTTTDTLSWLPLQHTSALRKGFRPLLLTWPLFKSSLPPSFLEGKSSICQTGSYSLNHAVYLYFIFSLGSCRSLNLPNVSDAGAVYNQCS